MGRLLLILCLLFWARSARADELHFHIDLHKCDQDRAFVASLEQKIDDDLLKSFHRILMDNELAHGCGALQFTDAEMASQKNGFSFGPSQFDLSTRQASLTTLMSVLKCGGGTGGLSVDDFAFIRQWATRPTSRLKQIPSVWRRFGALRPTIETALSSQCGKDILAAEYVNELKALAEPADEQWRILVAANPKMSAAEKFFKLYALDFANVVGAPDGFIGQVRNSNNVVCFALCKAGIVPSYHVSSPPTVVDLIRYQFEATCYGYVPEPTRQYDALRRLNRVLGEASVPSGILAENDKTYLAGRFADIVAMASSATSSDDLQNISELVSAADPPRDNAEHARPLSPDQLAAARAACQRS